MYLFGADHIFSVAEMISSALSGLESILDTSKTKSVFIAKCVRVSRDK